MAVDENDAVCSDTSTCGPVQKSKSSGRLGRRIYIHQDTLAGLANSDEKLARRAYSAFCYAGILKVIFHSVVQDAPLLGLVRQKDAELLFSQLANQWNSDITKLLKSIGYYDPSPTKRNAFSQVLDADESIVAVCFDAQYYTFATSNHSAKVMYDDNERIRSLRKRLAEGDKDERLTIIKGQTVDLIDKTLGTGQGIATFYRSRIRKRKQLSAVVIDDIKSEVINSSEKTVEQYLSKLDYSGPSSKDNWVEKVMKMCHLTTQTGVLRKKKTH